MTAPRPRDAVPPIQPPTPSRTDAQAVTESNNTVPEAQEQTISQVDPAPQLHSGPHSIETRAKMEKLK
ncbi:MAG: hypothetical protein Q9218_007631, partial [Villophora microphyllina]